MSGPDAHEPDPSDAEILTIWGASGSAPAAGPQRARWGGETVCFGLSAESGAGVPLLVDLGSGARAAGWAIAKAALAAGRAPQAAVLLSHLHLDHIWGAPFFAPFYKPGARVDLHCALYPDPADFAAALRGLISPPYFPIEPLDFGAAQFHALGWDAVQQVAGRRVRALGLNHPGGCAGFRIEGAGWSVAVIGDHEHGDPQGDAHALELSRGVDLLIYDACYDDAEYCAYVGWGHSTWQKGLELFAASGAAAGLFHHHAPERDDDRLDAIDAQVRAGSGGAAMLARQGMRWRLSSAGAALID